MKNEHLRYPILRFLTEPKVSLFDTMGITFILYSLMTEHYVVAFMAFFFAPLFSVILSRLAVKWQRP